MIEGAPSVEDLMAEGFTGEKLIDEMLRRGTATDREDARFRVGVTLEGGDVLDPKTRQGEKPWKE